MAVVAWSALLAPLALFGALVALALLWIGSRGKFMFLDSLVNRRYEHGFVTDIATESLPPGLDEDVVRPSDDELRDHLKRHLDVE